MIRYRMIYLCTYYFVPITLHICDWWWPLVQLIAINLNSSIDLMDGPELIITNAIDIDISIYRLSFIVSFSFSFFWIGRFFLLR